MANINAQIRPGGVDDKYVIDLMYMLQQSMYGLCLKLDAEGSGLTTYVANCYTAAFHTEVWDYRGNKTQNVTAVDHIVTPAGLTTAALIQWLYDWINSFETLCEQLDGDGGITDDANYEDLCYEALVLPYIFESGRYDQAATILGNTVSTGGFTTMLDSAGTPWMVTKIGPTGRPSDRVLCDLLYDIINAWETLCEKIDADATTAAPPAASNYEALWFTATVLMRVENSQGSVLGNTQTRLG